MFSESAHLYDTIYGALKDYAAEARAVAEVIRSASGGASTVLDVACGTGEHVKHLRRTHAFQADGLDLDPQLLELARRKVPEAQFVAGDMCSFHLQRRFDVVSCLFSAIGYAQTLEGLVAALRCFRRHLSANGLILVEPWFPPHKLHIGEGRVRRIKSKGVRIERRSVTEIDGRISRIRFTYLVEDAHGVHEATEVHELGLFTQAETLACFKAADLSATFDPEGISGRGLYLASAAAQDSSVV